MAPFLQTMQKLLIKSWENWFQVSHGRISLHDIERWCAPIDTKKRVKRIGMLPVLLY